MAQATPRRYPYRHQPLTRAEEASLYEQPWRAYKRAQGDELALRWLILRREGPETLINVIRGAHGLPNRF